MRESQAHGERQAHTIAGADIAAISVIQGCWVKCGRTSAIIKLMHAMSYLRNRSRYEADKERMRELANLRRKRTSGQFSTALDRSEVVSI